MSSNKKCGFVAFIGRPNAGKSTLLNKLVGEKIAAVSDKPQTTRTQIQGIITLEKGQIIFVDTPGVHKPGYKLNRRMMHAVAEATDNVDILLLMRDVNIKGGQGEDYVLDIVKKASKPSFLLLNKIDLVKDKSRLLPIIDYYSKNYNFLEIIPISARTGEGTDLLVEKLIEHLPEGEQMFPEDSITDKDLRTIVSELVREKILQSTHDELPFVTAVVCEFWEESEELATIHCSIYVERDSQKAIVIGKNGQKLKFVGTAARKEIKALLGKKVYLELFVKVQHNWRDDERVLDALGIEGKN